MYSGVFLDALRVKIREDPVLIVSLGLIAVIWSQRHAIPESRHAQERRVDVAGQSSGAIALASVTLAAIAHAEALPGLIESALNNGIVRRSAAFC